DPQLPTRQPRLARFRSVTATSSTGGPDSVLVMEGLATHRITRETLGNLQLSRNSGNSPGISYFIFRTTSTGSIRMRWLASALSDSIQRTTRTTQREYSRRPGRHLSTVVARIS